MLLSTISLGLCSALSTATASPAPHVDPAVSEPLDTAAAPIDRFFFASSADAPSPRAFTAFDPLAPIAAPIGPLAPVLLDSTPLGYTYVEASFVFTDLNGVPGTQNGYEFVGSWNLLAGLYLQGSFSHGDGDATIETYKLGAGYHIGLMDKLDVFGLLSYEHDYLAVGGASSNTGDGYEFDAGVRWMMLEKLELNGQLEWNHVNEDDFGVQAGARYYFTGPLSVGTTLEGIDQDFRLRVGARFQF
jgi:hypothetical protein